MNCRDKKSLHNSNYRKLENFCTRTRAIAAGRKHINSRVCFCSIKINQTYKSVHNLREPSSDVRGQPRRFSECNKAESDKVVTYLLRHAK